MLHILKSIEKLIHVIQGILQFNIKKIYLKKENNKESHGSRGSLF